MNTSRNNPIVHFMLEFESFMDQISRNMKMKQESASKLKQKNEDVSKLWELISRYQSRIDKLAVKGKNNEYELAIYHGEISILKKQLEELQQQKFALEDPSLSSFKDQIDQEATIGIQYIDSAYLLEKEIQKLRLETQCMTLGLSLQKSILRGSRLNFLFEFSTSVYCITK